MAELFYTVQEILDIVLQRMRAETGPSGPLFQVTLDNFNLALHDLNMQYQWRWSHKESTVATVDGTKKYELADDVLRVYTVRVNINGTYGILRLLEEDEARLAYPDDTSKGSPQAYISGIYTLSASEAPKKVIEIKPTPDAVYTLEYVYQSSIKKFTSGDVSEVPPIPQFMYSTLIEMVYKRMLAYTKASTKDIQEAFQSSILALTEAKQFDRDLNKSPRSIRLPVGITNYRANKYSRYAL